MFVTKRIAVRVWPVLAAVVLSASSVCAQQVVYRLVDLGQLAGAGSYATGINEAGVTSGWLITSTHDQRAARSINDRFALVPGLESATADAEGINALGDLAGSITLVPWPTNLIHAMRYTDTVGIEDLGTLGGIQASGTSINRLRQVVGWSYAGAGFHAFLATPGQPMRDLGTLGGVSSYAGGINDAGQVSGYAQRADGTFHAFLYTAGSGLQDLGAPNSYGQGINNTGQTVGYLITPASHAHPFRYTPGIGFEDLDPIVARNSQGWAINDRGDVVGTFGTNSYNHAFVYTDAEGLVDLNTRIVSGADGWVLVAAYGINSAGEIVGQGQYANQGPPRGFKLIPVTDRMPPDIRCDTPDGAWHGSDVSVLCTASDSGSGLANSADASFRLTTSSPDGTETANAATGSRSVCDTVGNCTTAGPVLGNKVDKKPPTITISSPTLTTYTLGQSVSGTYSCADGGSGIASCAGPVATGSLVDTSNVGAAGTFTVNAGDAANNVTSQSVAYSVAYGVCLLYDPAKAHRSGSTIPIKIQLCDINGANRSSVATTVTATGVVLLSTNASGVLEDSGSANQDLDFRYDSTVGGGGYMFNLKLGLGTGTYALTFQATNDSTVHAVQFQVK